MVVGTMNAFPDPAAARQDLGTVLRLDGAYAVVERERKSACMLCPEPETCPDLEKEGCTIQIRALNPIGARVGERVVLELDAHQRLLHAVALVYGVPMVLAGIGLVVGIALGGRLGWAGAASQVAGFAGIVAGLVVAVPASRMVNHLAERSGLFTPRVTSRGPDSIEV